MSNTSNYPNVVETIYTVILPTPSWSDWKEKSGTASEQVEVTLVTIIYT